MIQSPGAQLSLAMSCLDVMYQVYGPPQPYFAAAYSPYHQKLAFYSKMQEAPESASSASTSSSSFSSHAPASIKEEDCSPEKERPPEAEYINSRCVLFTYFQGDISSVVDEHFSRALSQPSSYSPSSASAKTPRSTGSWRDGSFPMSQRSFPASFWNSAYQPSSVPASLNKPTMAQHLFQAFQGQEHGKGNGNHATWHFKIFTLSDSRPTKYNQEINKNQNIFTEISKKETQLILINLNQILINRMNWTLMNQNPNPMSIAVVVVVVICKLVHNLLNMVQFRDKYSTSSSSFFGTQITSQECDSKAKKGYPKGSNAYRMLFG
nr:transcription cofactor vestigial-like protein 2 [Pelodiscus sinensis]|eukprot:XP_014429107.1 transcription cofactor vestigial-like protein 2 [Pelodiscus sinensis]